MLKLPKEIYLISYLIILILFVSGCSNHERKQNLDQSELGPYEQLEKKENANEPLVVGPDDFNDPIEPVNRVFFYVNDRLYRYLGSPVSKAYLKVMPKPVNQCVTNAFKNLREPLYLVNHALQLQPKKAGKSFLRFCINSTVGLLGLFDPAEAWFGLERDSATLGQTLSSYGLGYGFYIVVPVLGPNTLRDTASLTFEYYAHPIKYLVDSPEATGFLFYEGFHQMSPTLRDYPGLVEPAEDAYIFIRNLYLQRKLRDELYRENEVIDSDEDA